MPRPRGNPLCPCGSGLRYQSCCGIRENTDFDPRSVRASMERHLASVERLLAEEDFESVENLDAYLQEAVSRGDPLPGPTTPQEEAQELVFQAWESSGRRQQLSLARRALQLDPDCADAHVILGDLSPTPQAALPHYQDAVASAMRRLGLEIFQEEVGHFWEIWETRPYMRARHGLAQCLWALGTGGPAVEHLQEMLGLNPGDNQGVRFGLILWLFELDDLESLQELLNREEYAGDLALPWLISRALVSFLQQGDTADSRELLTEAMLENPFVSDYLLERKRLPRRLPDFMSPGNEDEAIHYLARFGSTWRKYPQARAWLEAVIETEGIDNTSGESPPGVGTVGAALAPVLSDDPDDLILYFDPTLEVEASEHIEPSVEEWRALYQAAVEFRNAGIWEWLDGDEIFAVADPVDGQVGYCSVMGAGGVEYGLALFVGDAGYESHQRLTAYDVDSESFESAALLNSLSVTFGSRDELDKQDYQVIRTLGLRFRGRSAWPLFRSKDPGWFPWYLDRDAARRLTVALEQSLAIFGGTPGWGDVPISPREDGLVLTRLQKQGQWVEEWRKPGHPAAPGNLEVSFDPERITALHERITRPSGIWEVDLFPVPAILSSKTGRPYFPHVALAVDRSNGEIVGTYFAGPPADSQARQEAVIRLFEFTGKLPRQVRVSSNVLLAALEPATQALGIRLRRSVLPSLEEAKESLMEMLLAGEDFLEDIP